MIKKSELVDNSYYLKICFLLILSIKICILGIFSSDYQNSLFIPFVKHFATNLDDPWQWVYQTKSSLEFPYHPLMLYTFTIGMWLINLLQTANVFLINFLFKFPIVLADLGIFWLMVKTTKSFKKALLYYFASPIILYASYMHSQLDLVPEAFLFFSFYLLKNKKLWQAAFICAMSCCFKANAVLLLPIFLIYVYKHTNFEKTIYALSLIVLTYAFFSYPYILHDGYYQMVLFNPKQNLFFDLSLSLGNVIIYIPLLCVIFIYLNFFSYTKINNNLLDAFCCLTNSVFLTIVPPTSPAWFVWLVPFLCLFLINFSEQNRHINIVYIFLNVMYLFYFVVCHVGDYNDLTVWQSTLNLKTDNVFVANFAYTLLEAGIICLIYLTYSLSVKNNALYKKKRAILIGISGDSGSGKTTLLGDLKGMLKDNLLTLEGDGTHKWWRGSKKWSTYTHLDPKANYLYEQISSLSNLRRMKTIDYRHYNHNTGTFEVIKRMKPKNFIVLAGLHAFYLPKMRKMMNLKIFLDPDEKLRLYWKEKRDIAQRNYTAKDVKKISEDRKKDAHKYILPQKRFADMVVHYFIDEKNKNKLQLRIDIDSDLPLDDLLVYLRNNNVSFQWDYSEDLQMQYLILNSESKMKNIADLILNSIENMEEIVENDFDVQNGYRGIVQFLILKMISRKMKEDYDD